MEWNEIVILFFVVKPCRVIGVKKYSFVSALSREPISMGHAVLESNLSAPANSSLVGGCASRDGRGRGNVDSNQDQIRWNNDETDEN